MRDTLDVDLADWVTVDLVFDQRVGGVRDQNLVGRGGRLKTRGGVYLAADDGVVEPIIGAEIADRAEAGIDADADMQLFGDALIYPFLA